MGLVLIVGGKSWDIQTFPTAGNINNDDFKLCDCPQSKAIEKGCDLGNCRNISNLDIKNSWSTGVANKLSEISDSIDTEVNANRFFGLSNTITLIVNYLTALQTDVKKHYDWLGRMTKKSRRERCCQSVESLTEARGYDDYLTARIKEQLEFWNKKATMVSETEEIANSQTVTNLQLQTAVNNYNVNAAAAQEQIAAAEEKTSEATTTNTLRYIGIAILGIVVVYFAIKMFKK
jgi:hypothetical protein